MTVVPQRRSPLWRPTSSADGWHRQHSHRQSVRWLGHDGFVRAAPASKPTAADMGLKMMRHARLRAKALLTQADAAGAGVGDSTVLVAGTILLAAAFALGTLVGRWGDSDSPRGAGVGLRLGLGAGTRLRDKERTVDLLDYFLKYPGPAITLATLAFGITFAKISELEKTVALDRLEVEKNVFLTCEQLRNTVAVDRQELEKTVALNRQELEKTVALGQQETRFLVGQLSAKVDKIAQDVRELQRQAP